MPQLLVRDMDKDTIQRLKTRARDRGRSLQAEAKRILEKAAHNNPEDYRAAIHRFHEQLGDRVFSDSAELIRQDRER